MVDPVQVTRRDGPVILGIPHAGTWLPPDVFERLNATGQALADTDWHVDRLYAGLLPNATVVSAKFHRYLIDANRDPSGISLYPGQNTTALVPLTDFDGQPIWENPPGSDEVTDHSQRFHQPYHAALKAEVERIRRRHGVALLFDCHSIRSRIPFLFDGRLPDLSIGTNNGVTCDPVLERIVVESCALAKPYKSILNGRFKGGWTTRAYGQPGAGVHAIQMELAQSTYLKAEAAPWEYDPDRAAGLRALLGSILERLETEVLGLKGKA